MPPTRSSEKPKSILKKAGGSDVVEKSKGKEHVVGGKAAGRVAKRAGEENVAARKKHAGQANGVKEAGQAEKPSKVLQTPSSLKQPGKQTGQTRTAAKPKSARVQPEKKVVVVEKGEEEEEEKEEAEAADDSEGEDSDDEDILHGLSDADSSDEDDEGDEHVGEITKSGVVKLPSSRDDAVVKSRLDTVHKKKKESGRSSTPMVLYFGRVPKSMPEEPLRTYLSQFGDISRLRLSRNRKTGASKHYAFVEFEDEEVGQIVQETMNNYLLEGRLLQVRVLPKDKVHPSLWVGADRKWRKVPETRRFRVGHDEPKTGEERARVEKKLLKRQEQRRSKIAGQGIEYDFEGYV